MKSLERDAAWDYALHLLSYHSFTRQEMEKRLQRKGYSEELAQSVVQRLEELGLLDDREYARRWIERHKEGRPAGRRLLAWQLRQKGVEENIVATQLAEDLSREEERELALALARKQLNSLGGLEKRKLWSRLAGFLQRRGFEWELVEEVLRTLLGEEAT